MRIAFFGTPQLAARYLEHLSARHEIVAAVTQCDRPRGRDGSPCAPPVKQVAEGLGIPVLQPERGQCGEPCRRLAEIRPQVCVVVAFGQIIPCEPPPGEAPLDYINVHYSLLPQLRGAAPVQHAILQGLERTGVTIQHLAAELDAGDVILQRVIGIRPDDTTASLLEALTDLGIEALDEALDLLEAGGAPGVPQDHSQATWAPQITKAQGRIDWACSAAAIDRQIRAFTPWPGSHTCVGGSALKIICAKPDDIPGDRGGEPGTLVEVSPECGFAVSCGEGLLWVTQVQPAGKRAMPAQDYLNGARLEIGARFG